MTKQKVPVWEAQLLHAAKKFPGLSREQLIARLPEKQRFDAARGFMNTAREQKLVEIGGRFYVPSATAAIAALKAHASA